MTHTQAITRILTGTALSVTISTVRITDTAPITVTAVITAGDSHGTTHGMIRGMTLTGDLHTGAVIIT